MEPSSSTASLKQLVKALIHDVRNQINGIVLELTDLRERWPEERVTTETAGLMRQAMEMADRLHAIRERLDPSPPRLQLIPLSQAWTTLAPQAGPVAHATPTTALQIDLSQISTALMELVANATEAGGLTAPLSGEVKAGFLEITLTNHAATEPAEINHWDQLPGFTTKRRRLGLGCSYAATVAAGHGGSCAWTYEAATQTVRATLRLPLESGS